MLTEFEKNKITFQKKINLQQLVKDSLNALKWNESSMDWNWKFR